MILFPTPAEIGCDPTKDERCNSVKLADLKSWLFETHRSYQPSNHQELSWNALSATRRERTSATSNEEAALSYDVYKTSSFSSWHAGAMAND